MSQWDGMPETPPPASMMGKQGRKALDKVRDGVIALSKPPTEDQVRAVTDARQAMVSEIITDPEFAPDARIAELEGILAERVEEIEALVSELSAQRGAQRWQENVLMAYRPAVIASRGPAVQRLRLNDLVSAADLVAGLRETLGLGPRVDPAGRVRVPEFSHNPSKVAA